MSGRRARQERRLEVGWYVETLAPLTVVSVQMQLGRMLGADAFWFGDHVAHAIPDALWDPKMTPMARFIPSLDAWFDPTVLIARYGRRWRRPMGVSVTDPFRRSAADLARAWLSLHHTSGGRVVLGIGAGERMNLDPVGESFTRPVARLEDTLSAIRAVWSSGGGQVTHSGPFHRWENAAFLPPYRGSTPPIWVAAEGPRACEVAGRWGDGWISYTPQLKLWQAADNRVAEGAEAAGRDPIAIDRSLFVMTVLANTAEELHRACSSPFVQMVPLAMPARAWCAAGLQHPLGEGPGGTGDLDPAVFEGSRWAELRRLITPEVVQQLVPCGSAESVAEQLADFVDNGVSHMVVTNLALMGGGSSSGTAAIPRSLAEQYKLIRLLKRMCPKTR
ncbi:MAG: phthiodiolone/phenolphthiodiolone dimycocerosates ketoreductase [Mycobacterium sp.]|nr:phthiodiolone/phenolphthiodiolone dimycocerosates ketoreductase [Mycobacterium sp.]